MKRLIALILALLPVLAKAQELYVNTEPASNMAAHSLGIRLENQGYSNSDFRNRTTLELMYGASKSLMVHGTGYVSNFYHSYQHLEGASVYAKYRFLSIDTVQRHFRGAVFAKVSAINNPVINQEIALEGDNSGFQGGFVFTQLLHKLALSASGSYLRAFNNINYHLPAANAKDALGWSLSAGYLLFPKNYQNYRQVNFNIYLELLGKANPGYGQSYTDVAPAAQLIINSQLRVDLSYRTPLWNHMTRNSKNMYLLRVEYNLFNIL